MLLTNTKIDNSLCPADFISICISKKANNLPIEPNEIKSCTVPVSYIDDVKLKPNIFVVKNKLGKMQKHS